MAWQGEHCRIINKYKQSLWGFYLQAGFDPAYGARPLNRLLNKDLLQPLARSIIEGSVHDGDKVNVSLGADRLIIQPEPRDPASSLQTQK